MIDKSVLLTQVTASKEASYGTQIVMEIALNPLESAQSTQENNRGGG
jgi:hypothetical protein